MTKTRKDIFVQGRTAEEIRMLVQNWFAENKIDVIENKLECIKGRWGIGLATARKYFQVSFMPAQNGVMACTEGWISAFGEQDFSPSAVMGGIPRREGWQAMERLWYALQAFSNTAYASPPQAQSPPQVPLQAGYPCPTCGAPLTYVQQYNRWYCYNCKKYA